MTKNDAAELVRSALTRDADPACQIVEALAVLALITLDPPLPSDDDSTPPAPPAPPVDGGV